LPTNPVAPDTQTRRGPDLAAASGVAISSVPATVATSSAGGLARGRRGFVDAGRLGAAFGFGAAGSGLEAAAFVRRARGRGSVISNALGATTDQ
jgi:hypothetical protein